MLLRLAPLLLVLLGLSVSLFGRDYYVSRSGNDANPGTIAQPWLTLGKASSAQLAPGDRLLLEAGKSFDGTLALDAHDAGMPDRPIIITSYGNGRAVINAGNGTALSLAACRHVVVSELSLRGSGRKAGNAGSGALLTRVEGVELRQIDVSGFRSSGIEITGSRDVRLTHIHAFSNGFAGIASHGEMSSNLYVGYSLAENNPGDPTIKTNHSGNGIVIGKVDGALIEYCEARYNGWDMPRKGNGPVGIWTWESNQVIIQYCVAHHNRSTGIDGGGFDFDGGVKNSILQYNYSHNNHGSGYLICQYSGASAFRNNIVRYNISQDDGLTNHNAGIHVWVGGPGMESTEVYNNTIFNSKGAAVSFGVARDYRGPLPDITFRNNIFVAGEAQIEGGAEKGRFEGNLYWAMGDGGFLVDGYTNFDEWVKATGQETRNGRVVGQYADPLLRKDECGLLTDPARLSELVGYLLLPGSPAIDRGLNLRHFFGTEVGGVDFYGNQVPAGAGFDIGAHEFMPADQVSRPPLTRLTGSADRERGGQ
jgi:hypothetical protein